MSGFPASNDPQVLKELHDCKLESRAGKLWRKQVAPPAADMGGNAHHIALVGDLVTVGEVASTGAKVRLVQKNIYDKCNYSKSIILDILFIPDHWQS